MIGLPRFSTLKVAMRNMPSGELSGTLALSSAALGEATA